MKSLDSESWNLDFFYVILYTLGLKEEMEVFGLTLQQLKYVIAIAEAGSLNEAAKNLFIAQPSLSGSMKELEKEIGFELFIRTNRGIKLTSEGEEFLGYARQVCEQYTLLEEKYIGKKGKKKFSVSMQHYTFAVKAFIEMAKHAGMDTYEFAVYETKTYEVIENVKTFKSELGILYITDFNRQIVTRVLAENSLEFVELFQCDTYVYLWAGHPLADKEVITMEQLQEYPCLQFDQGRNNSFFLAEEMKSTYQYRKVIKANDRATMLNLMVGIQGYTLCSGIICEELNGQVYMAVPLQETEKMTIGYIKRKGSNVSEIGQIYIEELRKYQESVL